MAHSATGVYSYMQHKAQHVKSNIKMPKVQRRGRWKFQLRFQYGLRINFIHSLIHSELFTKNQFNSENIKVNKTSMASAIMEHIISSGAFHMVINTI